jgi:molybdenum cofactor synthesis domain-containing protein
VISLDEAQHYVRQTLTPLPPLELSLDDALGCVVAEELTARERVPGFLNSAMDGYALRSIDTSAGSVRLRVTGSVMAGDVPAKRLAGGEAMRIMTGAPVPDGADCVCKIEEVTVAPNEYTVTINRTIRIGENVRHPGEDIAVGQILVAPGTELGPTELGVLASQGFTSVRVHPRPRVGVLSTGNELAGSTGPLKSGKIRDINRPMLLASLRQSGFTPVDLGIIRDDQSALAEVFQKAVTECDAVISTGGVSVGDVDHVKTVITDLCAERARWMQVAIKPGKPFTFGVAGASGAPVFGLPGNPVSTLVGFEMYVRPSLRLLAGQTTLERPTFSSVLDCPLPRSRDGKLHLAHVVVNIHEDGRAHIESVRRQGSHLVSAIAGANAIAMIPDGSGFAIGETVRTIILGTVEFASTPVWAAQ